MYFHNFSDQQEHLPDEVAGHDQEAQPVDLVLLNLVLIWVWVQVPGQFKRRLDSQVAQASSSSMVLILVVRNSNQQHSSHLQLPIMHE